MTANALVQSALFVVLLLVLARPLGGYMHRVLTGESRLADRLLGPLERLLYRLAGVDPARETGWKPYALAMLLFNFAGLLVVYALQRLQGMLPLNPVSLGAVTPDSAFNTAVSFATNTNWQGYAGEVTMSTLTQMLALTVQNFVSAATGIAVLAALTRGFARRSAETVGNFWVDMVRSTLYILLPLSLVLALALVSQGVVQNLDPPTAALPLESPAAPTAAQPPTPAHIPAPEAAPGAAPVMIATGPVASQVAIKQLGTNGGGYFNVNSAHPYENPTPGSNFLELLAILLIGAGLCDMFGRWVGDWRQGWAIMAAMTILFAGFLAVGLVAEQADNPRLAGMAAAEGMPLATGAGSLEGKETRFGVTGSVLWAVATTAASNGSVNSMHDSMTPLGGMVPMMLMQLGEIIFGGVGSGLYGMLVLVLVTVFMGGLMVGRTPEYLGKKVGAFEMKMCALVILVPAAGVLLGTALAVSLPAGRAGILNGGPHGFSEILYAFSSAANNNGSAFAGLSANTPFYNLALALAMLFGRFWVAVPVLAIAGSMAARNTAPAGPGTLPTHTPLFVAFLVFVVLTIGALTFIPALALGPIVEQLQFAAPR